MRILAILAGLIVALVILVWLGRKIEPGSFAAFAQRTGPLSTIPLPAGLPAPVERFYRQRYGDSIPVITSAVISGRAQMRPAGPLFFPARFRFSYVAGQAYRHYIEMTLFGLPLIKANEHYVNGKGRMDITVIGTDEGEKIDEAANLSLWAEASLFPAVYLTDQRVRWQAIDDDTAVLVVPFRDGPQRFVVRFDSATGWMTWIESMRYHSSSSTGTVLWLNHFPGMGTLDGKPFPTRGDVIWMDDGKPWFSMTVEDAVFNVDVGEYIRATGP